MTIEPVWHLVRKVRADVSSALTHYPDELRVAAIMTASELVENAIKYGDAIDHAPDIRVSLAERDGSICIETANGSTNEAGVAELLRVVQQVSEAEDKGSLYVARLEQLLASPSESGRLGIYRIAFEGRFDIACTYENRVVVVTATRKLS